MDIKKIIYRCLILIAVGMLGVLSIILILSRDLPSLEQLENYDPDLVTRIYSAAVSYTHLTLPTILRV